MASNLTVREVFHTARKSILEAIVSICAYDNGLHGACSKLYKELRNLAVKFSIYTSELLP